MYEIDDPDLRKEKCYTTIGKLPPFVDPQQPPIKKSPFSSISKHSFVHSVSSLASIGLIEYLNKCKKESTQVLVSNIYLKTSLILPKEIYDSVWDSISSRIRTPQYAKVIMPLSALLAHDFLKFYIKIGIQSFFFSFFLCHFELISTVFLRSSF